MNIKEYKEKAELIRHTSVYDVYDYKKLQNLALSLTELHPRQKTGGHSHDADEVYIFIQGRGAIKIGEEIFACKKGDTFVIPRGQFHQVINRSRDELKFWSIFEKYGERT